MLYYPCLRGLPIVSTNRSLMITEPPPAFAPAATWQAYARQLERLQAAGHPEVRQSLLLAKEHLARLESTPASPNRK